MPARTVGVWGIDLGQCALKAIRLEMKDDQPVATAFEYIEHPKILSQPDADPDELTREALNQFLSRNQIRGDIIAISVPGQSGLARFVKLPPVDEKKIADIVKFEAKQQIPFPLDEVVWDFQRLNRGDVVDGLALETEIGLFAMKRDMVNRAIAQFKEVGVEVHLVQMAPLALCNFVGVDLLDKTIANLAEESDDAVECIVCLEIGTDSSNLVITNGGRIIWQRPIPIGGNHFTRALTKEMKLTFAKAEHLKKNASKSPELKKILSSLKQVLNDFVGEVQRSLGYFTNTHRNAQILYMVGLGNAFRLPGLQKFLQEKLQLEVRKFKELTKATGESVTGAPTFVENVMSFGVAYGSALQGLKQARLQTNLLPYEVRLERVIRGKKPWVVAAAACLLFGLFMLAFAQGMEKRALDSKELKDAQKGALAEKNIASSLKSQYDESSKKLVDVIKSLNTIGAGVNERVNWQLLHQYVNLATPQPNGDRLAVQAARRLVRPKDLLWDSNKDSREAFAMYERKRFSRSTEGQPPDAEEAKKIEAEDSYVSDYMKRPATLDYLKKLKIDPSAGDKNERRDWFVKSNLIQVNIAGINAVYSDDLTMYYKKIYDDLPNLPGMLDEEAKKIKDAFAGAAKQGVLDGPRNGWVVEIRGYTYHKDPTFIENTIVENLQNPTYVKDKELVERIKKPVSHLLVYKNERVETPKTGQFEFINKSYLPTLVHDIGVGAKMGDAQKQPPPQVPPPPGGKAPGDPAEKEKVKVLNRDHWRPIGEIANALFGGPVPQGRGDMHQPNIRPPQPPIKPGVPLGKKTGDVLIAPRTEFVILFIWREPVAEQQAIVLEDTKK